MGGPEFQAGEAPKSPHRLNGATRARHRWSRKISSGSGRGGRQALIVRGGEYDRPEIRPPFSGFAF